MLVMSNPRIIFLPDIGSVDIGQLVVAEGENVPFQINRAYWTFGVPPDKIRGHHAHYELEQLIVSMCGTLSIIIETPDRIRHSFELDHPSMALYILRMCWREIKFSSNAVLLCLASMEYIETDYIRSYYEYAKIVAAITT
jgi:hypothetical protein